MEQNRDRDKKKIWKYFFGITAVIILLLIPVIWRELKNSTDKLELSAYAIDSEEITSRIRIVQLTDLHNSVFGENNADLIKVIKDQEPDLILCTGDMLNSQEKDMDTSICLISELVEVAPTYISLGNHEEEYKEIYDIDPAEYFETAGATVLEKKYLDISVNDQLLRLGGIYGYCLSEKYIEGNILREKESNFVKEFQQTDRYSILMCHMPVSWILNEGLDEWDVDCVLAGHVHGGQVIFPVLGGLYAPDFGWFPGKLEGIYQSGDEKRQLILSRGLGSTEKIPRFNNHPEVVTIDLI